MEKKTPDIVLVMAPPWDTSQPPINIAYLSAYARSRGLNPVVFDLNIKLSTMARNLGLKDLWLVMGQNLLSSQQLTEQMFEAAPQVIEGQLRRILATGAPCIGFSIHSRNVDFTERLTRRIRELEPGRRIIYGGPEVTISHAVGTLGRLAADAYVVGEGEHTLVDLLEQLDQHGELRPVPGVVLSQGDEGQLTTLEPRPPIHPIDQLPFPDWEEFDVSWYAPDVERSLPMLFSRGCTGQCTFCMDHQIAGRYRCRSAENVLAEMKRDMEQYGISHFHFNDLICNGNPRKLEQLADSIVEQQLDVMWWSYGVVRRGLSPELFAKLRASGCSALVFGLESGSDKVLRLMNKYYDAAEAEQVLHDCAGAGLNTAINIIVGFPGETRVEHQQTLDFIERNRKVIHRVVNLGTCLLTPGAELYQNPEKFGIKQDEQGRTWYTDDGNTIDERNRRLNEVQQLLDRLGIPRVIINRELGFDQFTVEQDDDAQQQSIQSPLRIFDVQYLDLAEQDTKEFATGEMMNMIVRFQVAEPVDDALVRVQIFNDQNPQHKNLMLFGMNTDRAKLPVGRLEPGWVEVRLLLFKLDFMPGKYLTTVGLFPNVEAGSAYDVRHGQHLFLIRGEQDPTGAKVHMDTSWQLERDGAAAGEGANRIVNSRLTDGQGMELPAFSSRQPMCLHVECDLPTPEGLVLEVTIIQDGVVLNRVQSEPELPPGRAVHLLTYEAMILLEGNYEVQVALLDPQADKQLSELRRGLRVASVGDDGGGLMFLPNAWEIHKHPSS